MGERLSTLERENEELKRNISSLQERDTTITLELSRLKSMQKNEYAQRKALERQLDAVEKSAKLDADKGELLRHKLLKELLEEERLVRSNDATQRNYDRLYYRYESLANAPLGRLTLIIWSVYNKIRKDSKDKKK